MGGGAGWGATGTTSSPRRRGPIRRVVSSEKVVATSCLISNARGYGSPPSRGRLTSPQRKVPPRGGTFLLSFTCSHSILLRTSGPSDPAGPDHPDGSGPAAAGRASGRRPAAGRASDPGSDSAGPGSGSG